MSGILQTNNFEFQAVVVGGGPAGSAAAFTLASHGIRTCVVDRSRFPRDKLCGGFLTLRSKKIFEGIFKAKWDEVIEGVSRGISVFYCGKLLAEVTDYSSLFATQRIRFDNFLLQLAQREGALLHTNRAVKRVDFKRNLIVMSDESRFRFEYLVGADGVNSVVARELFGKSFNPKTIGFGIEVSVPRTEFTEFPSVPEVHLGAVSWGYGWVFPKNNHAVIGVGGMHRKNMDMMERFRSFLQERCGQVATGRVKGHFLPYGEFRRVPGMNNVLLAGDAAGLVDSLTGEGIAFAMQSGDAAALSIIDCISKQTNQKVLDSYIQRYGEITSLIRLSNRYRPLVFLPIFENVFARTLVGAKTIQHGYLDIFADEIRYENMPRLMVRQLCRSMYPLWFRD